MDRERFSSTIRRKNNGHYTIDSSTEKKEAITVPMRPTSIYITLFCSAFFATTTDTAVAADHVRLRWLEKLLHLLLDYFFMYEMIITIASVLNTRPRGTTWLVRVTQSSKKLR